MDITKNKTLFQALKQIYKTYSATKVKKVKLKIFIAVSCPLSTKINSTRSHFLQNHDSVIKLILKI